MTTVQTKPTTNYSAELTTIKRMVATARTPRERFARLLLQVAIEKLINEQKQAPQNGQKIV